MTCANCQALRTEVENLRRQLGLSVERDGIVKLNQYLKLSVGQARIVLLLYYRGGWVATHTILDSTDVSDNSLRVQIGRIRRIRGREFLLSMWGQGYRLSEMGAEQVRGALACL